MRWAFNPSTTQKSALRREHSRDQSCSTTAIDPAAHQAQPRPSAVNLHPCCPSLPGRLCPGGTPGTKDVGGPFRGRPCCLNLSCLVSVFSLNGYPAGYPLLGLGGLHDTNIADIDPPHSGGRDRKSTRLNSSHLG